MDLLFFGFISIGISRPTAIKISRVLNILFQMVNNILGVTVLYYLSNQPFDVFRFTYFQIFCAATALVAQAIGFFLGAWAPIKVGLKRQVVGRAVVGFAYY